MAQRSLELEQPIARAQTRHRLRFNWSHTVSYLFLGAWSLFTVFALSWVVLASLKTNRDVFRNPFQIPAEPQFVNYQRVWDNSQVGQSFVNSLVIVGLSVIFILAVSAPAAYILSRAKFKGRGLLTMVYIAGIGVPYPLLFIPLFALMAGLKLINTMPGLILIYVSLSIPFTVYILTGFFGSLPQELEDAAVIDGATDFEVFRKVMLPLASPGLITSAIFNFIALWNEFQLALIFIQDLDLVPPIRRNGKLVDPKRKARADLVSQARLDGIYGQRWQVETVNSVIKRLMGDTIRSRSLRLQRREPLLKAMAYNLHV